MAAILFGLLPIMWSTGSGSEVMKRIAAPMIGGVVTSAVLGLLLYPVLYVLWRAASGLLDPIPACKGMTIPAPTNGKRPFSGDCHAPLKSEHEN